MVQLAGNDIADETTEALERAARRRGESVDSVLRSLLGIDRHETSAASLSLNSQFEVIWDRIQALVGTDFTTRSGQVFTYAIEREYLLPSTSDVRIPVSQFRRAFAVGPVRGPASFRGIFAPSIVWAVLNDGRVHGGVAEPAASVVVVAASGQPFVESEGSTVAGHTWPDDCGTDILEPAVLDASVTATPADVSAEPTGSDAATDDVAQPVPTDMSEEPMRVPAVAALESAVASRGFLKRIFGGR
ncbi:MAG: hypothetical protein HYY34_05635 [Chloroflexi bacterium]|nr:hypothetical protein [Chloroflexota bacterium]